MSIYRYLHSSEPRCLLKKRFGDMEALSGAVGWTQGFCQLEAGALDANACIVGHEACRVVRIEFNHSFHQRGSPSGPFIWFGLPDLSVENLRIGGIDVMPMPLVDFSYQGGLDATSSQHFSGTMLAFRPELLAQAADINCMDPACVARIGRRPYWGSGNRNTKKLRELVNTVFDACDEPDYGDWLREHRDLFDFELAAATLKLLCEPDRPLVESPSSRHGAVKRALKVLDECDISEMTVAELCRASSASMSTLNRGFKQEFGISPKTYMRARRLVAVQKSLIRADPDTKVAEVANRWGFWHMGSFAADYRKQFGELPSETLARLVSSA